MHLLDKAQMIIPPKCKDSCRVLEGVWEVEVTFFVYAIAFFAFIGWYLSRGSSGSRVILVGWYALPLTLLLELSKG